RGQAHRSVLCDLQNDRLLRAQPAPNGLPSVSPTGFTGLLGPGGIADQAIQSAGQRNREILERGPGRDDSPIEGGAVVGRRPFIGAPEETADQPVPPLQIYEAEENWVNTSENEPLLTRPLQRHLPPPFPVVVGPTTVHLDQQPFRLRIAVAADIQPPATNRGHGEVRRVVRGADDHVAIVERHIVDAGGDRPAQGPTGIVVVQHLAVLPSPAAARILEVADPFLFLRIDANDWQAMSYVPTPQPRQVAKLFIPVGILNPREPLAVG